MYIYTHTSKLFIYKKSNAKSWFFEKHGRSNYIGVG